MSVSSGSASQVVIPVTDIVYTVSVVAVSDLPSVQVEGVPGTHTYLDLVMNNSFEVFQLNEVPKSDRYLRLDT